MLHIFVADICENVYKIDKGNDEGAQIEDVARERRTTEHQKNVAS